MSQKIDKRRQKRDSKAEASTKGNGTDSESIVSKADTIVVDEGKTVEKIGKK